MKILLCRHGEAVSAGENPERPLSEKGVQEIKKLAGFLEREGVKVHRVFHSGKERARQTADILASAIAKGVTIEERDYLNPADDPAHIANDFGEFTVDTLIVGHLPFMDMLVSRVLTGQNGFNFTSFRPGTVVCLENIEGAWSLAWMLPPDISRAGEHLLAI